MTSVKKRLDHVINELNKMDTEPNEEVANNVVAEIAVIKSAYRETENAPMCCFKYDAEKRMVCDVEGPLSRNEFMIKCKECQAHMKTIITCLKTD